jgi:hypothetical protein
LIAIEAVLKEIIIDLSFPRKGEAGYSKTFGYPPEFTPKIGAGITKFSTLKTVS